MAYMSQEKKAKLAPAIKTILKKHGVKGSIAVRNHSTLVVNISKGSIDFGGDRIQVNPYLVSRALHWTAPGAAQGANPSDE